MLCLLNSVISRTLWLPQSVIQWSLECIIVGFDLGTSTSTRPKHKHMTDTWWSKHAVAWKTTQSSLTHSSAPTSGVSLAVSLWVRMGCLCVRFWRARPSYISIIYADITSRPLAFSGWPLLLRFGSDNVRQREANTSNWWVINTSWWGLTYDAPESFPLCKGEVSVSKGKVR